MQPISPEVFADLCGGTYHGPSGLLIKGFATDSRQVAAGDLFIAIGGENVDGHEFAEASVSSGAVAVLSERTLLVPHILVGTIVDGLATYGKNLRSTFTGPVIGITGSAGKTTTKEFVAAALGSKGKVLKSEGNRNTEYTSPLIWSELESDTEFAVVEMAMRGFGQIAHLAQIASPTMGIVTNIGHAHLKQLGSRDGIAKAKGELLENLPEDGVAILWEDDDYLNHLLQSNGDRPYLTFGVSSLSDCVITGYQVESWTSAVIQGVSMGVDWQVRLPAVGRHMALDAAAAILTAHQLGIDPQEAASQIENVKLPPMRMEVKDVQGAVVLLDTYNASPASMIAAMDTLSEMPVEGRRIAILGQMLELGDVSVASHRQIGEVAIGQKHRHASILIVMRLVERQVAKGNLLVQEKEILLLYSPMLPRSPKGEHRRKV